VFRCYNSDVFDNLNGVLEGILIEINGGSLALPPLGEGARRADEG